MVELYYVLEVTTLLASLALACVLFARDPGQRINRRMAMVPLLVSFWSLGELAWNLQPDAERAEFWIRVTALGWMLLGPAALHIYAELVGRRHAMARRLVPYAYALSTLVYAVHLQYGFGHMDVRPLPWGYGFSLEPSFALLYATMAAPMAFLLISTGRIFPRGASVREQRISRAFHVALMLCWVFATAADIVPPLVGIPFPPLGSLSILLIACGLAYQFKRHGYSLMAPSVFAAEILEALGEGVVMIRANGRIRAANETFARLLGTDAAALRDEPFARFAPGLDVAPAEMTRDIECDLTTLDGGTVRVSISPTLLRNPTGKAGGVALLVRDLREVTALRGSLVVSDRLAMVGGLSASISDEIREPVERVRSHLEGVRERLGLLRELAREVGDDEKLDELVVDREELLEECIEGVTRVESIVRDVRGFAQGQIGPRERVDPNRMIEDALRIAVARVDRNIRFERHLEAREPLECCPGEIVQVLVNLLVNAIHATEVGGRIELASFRNRDEVWICIEDDGSGIAPDVASRIFDPFFTTKPVGEGTGLGLAISLHIVHNHGGDLRVESEAGRGSRFTLALPIDPATPVVRGPFGGVLSG